MTDPSYTLQRFFSVEAPTAEWASGGKAALADLLRSHAEFVFHRCEDGATIAHDMREAAAEIERLQAILQNINMNTEDAGFLNFDPTREAAEAARKQP